MGCEEKTTSNFFNNLVVGGGQNNFLSFCGGVERIGEKNEYLLFALFGGCLRCGWLGVKPEKFSIFLAIWFSSLSAGWREGKLKQNIYLLASSVFKSSVAVGGCR